MEDTPVLSMGQHCAGGSPAATFCEDLDLHLCAQPTRSFLLRCCAAVCVRSASFAKICLSPRPSGVCRCRGAGAASAPYECLPGLARCLLRRRGLGVLGSVGDCRGLLEQKHATSPRNRGPCAEYLRRTKTILARQLYTVFTRVRADASPPAASRDNHASLSQEQ